MQVRRAHMGDIPWLIEAGEAAQAEAPHYRDYRQDLAQQYKALVGMLQFPEQVFIGVCDDETGFLVGSMEPTIWFAERVAVQGLLWVAATRRGTPRAWRLIQAFEDWARAQGAARILNGVSSGLDEERTGRFYEKMGYLPMGMGYFKEL